MANIDAANGFTPYTSQSGVGNPAIEYQPLSTANALIGIGDPLTIAAGVITKAVAGDALCGIAAEAKAANSGGKIAFYADPDQRFTAQTDNGTGTLTSLAGIGLNANFVAGVPVNGRSIAEIDESSGAVTATLPFKVLDLEPAVSNAFGEFNRLVVKINNHQLSTGTGTVGS